MTPVGKSGAIWSAPAKLNLFLHVNGRRDDGYHELQTCFQLIDLCDRVELRPRNDGRVRRLAPIPGVEAGADLTLRAARLLAEHAGSASGVDILVSKRIPMGAGLGGGSSDAATVLRALNELWGLKLPVEELAVVGGRLGADVPIFVHGRSAWAGGTGDRLWPTRLGSRHYAVIWPGVHVATAGVFADSKLTRDTPPMTMPGDPHSIVFRNDLQPVVAARHDEVREALRWLSRFGVAVMSGSGSSVFAPVDTRAEAERIVEQVPAPWRGFACRGLDRSPLLDELGR